MPLELGIIPPIGEWLVKQGIISPASQNSVKLALDNLPSNQRKPFFGDMAVTLGVTNEKTGQPFLKADLDQQLTLQTAQKLEAALKDIQTIETSGQQTNLPPFLKANWGNNGVNLADKSPTFAVALSAVANYAQNMVMLANDDVALARNKKVRDAIIAAEKIAQELCEVGILHRRGSQLSPTQLNDLLGEVEEGVIEAARNKRLIDANGNQINVTDFIHQRSGETRATFGVLSSMPQPQMGVLHNGANQPQNQPGGPQFSPHEIAVLNWHMAACGPSGRQFSHKLMDPANTSLHKGVEVLHVATGAVAYRVAPSASGAVVYVNMAGDEAGLREAVIKSIRLHGHKLTFEGTKEDKLKIQAIMQDLYANHRSELIGKDGKQITKHPRISNFHQITPVASQGLGQTPQRPQSWVSRQAASVKRNLGF